MQLKRIDFDKPDIPANGKNYVVQKDLSIARFKELEQMEVELYYGVTMQGMVDKLKDAFEDLNKSKIADSSVKIYRILEGIADKVDRREPVALRICTLFLVTEDEDVTKWDEDLAKQKIKDWQEEGYVVDDFFSLAAALVPGFLKDYLSIMEGTFLTEAGIERKQRLADTKKKLK